MKLVSSLALKSFAGCTVGISIIVGSSAFGQSVQSAPEFDKPNVEDLQRQIDELKAASNDVPVTSNNSNDDSGTTISWNPAPKLESNDGRFSFETNGRIIYDYGNVNFKDGAGTSRPLDKINGTEMRALEFGVRGKIFTNFEYRFVTKFINNEVDVKLAYIDYSIGNSNIIVGQTRTFTGLEKSTPSSNTSFSSRAAFLNILNASPRVGVGLTTHGDNWTISGGYFFESLATTNSSADDNNMVTSRITFSPQLSNGINLHFGSSAFYRNHNGNSFEHNYSDRPFSHQGTIKPLASQDFNTKSEQFLGLEFVASLGSFAAQSEYGFVKNKLSQNELLTMSDPTYKGGYFEISFFPTGGARLINASEGKFDNVEVKSPVGEGGMGEVKLAMRYDTLDLTHEIFGSKQNSYIFGADWYLNNNIKVQVNYAKSTIKNHLNFKTDIVDTFNLRVQLFW